MAVVLQEVAKSGYWWAYRILNSRYFGVAQNRRRVFIVGSLGNRRAGKVLFEPESGGGDNPPELEGGKKCLCLTARPGERNDATAETIVASTISTTDQYRANARTTRNYIVSKTIRCQTGQASPRRFDDGIVATYVRTQESGKRTQGYIGEVANTITAGQRGIERRPRQGDYIAEINANGKGKTARTPKTLDACRGLLIGNAVTVPVAEWIAKRIIEFEAEQKD